ncbi:MAG TPA: flavoprotein, partial [Thermoguttaceae bacterium]|nr:flavoprotein [Thermoguttaceae bacterium]
MKRSFVVAITGASGAAYSVRLVEVLLSAGCDVHLTISAAAQTVLKQELNLTVDLENFQSSSLRLEMGQSVEDQKLRRIRELAGISSEA